MYVSVAFGLVGIALADVFYVLSPGIPEALWLKHSALPYRWIYNKYFVDEFYDSTGRQPGGRWLARLAVARDGRRRH